MEKNDYTKNTNVVELHCTLGYFGLLELVTDA